MQIVQYGGRHIHLLCALGAKVATKRDLEQYQKIGELACFVLLGLYCQQGRTDSNLHHDNP